MSGVENKALQFMAALADVYRDEEDRESYAFGKLEMGNDITEDFTAMLIAMNILFDKFYNFEGDLIDFTHILNKLAVQYVLDKQEESENAENNYPTANH